MSTSANAPTESESTGLTFAEFVGAMVWLAIPYLIVGVFWADAHREHLEGLHGADAALSYLGEIVAWPLLIFGDITLK